MTINKDMDGRDACIAAYQSLRAGLGRAPTSREIFKAIGQHKLSLAFGSGAVSKLRIACGDPANEFSTAKVPIERIFEQYGSLVRENIGNAVDRLPAQSDWMHHRCRPPTNKLAESHQLGWRDVPFRFLDFANGRSEWSDCIAFVEARLPAASVPKPESSAVAKGTKSESQRVLVAIQRWTPQRRREKEEAYKVELRSYLEDQHFSVKEESGDSKADLVIDGKIPIELKKSPTLSEYDRLFGQLARHLVVHGSAIAVICDIERRDQFEEFETNVDRIYRRLGYEVSIVSI